MIREYKGLNKDVVTHDMFAIYCYEEGYEKYSVDSFWYRNTEFYDDGEYTAYVNDDEDTATLTDDNDTEMDVPLDWLI